MNQNYFNIGSLILLFLHKQLFLTKVAVIRNETKLVCGCIYYHVRDNTKEMLYLTWHATAIENDVLLNEIFFPNVSHWMIEFIMTYKMNYRLTFHTSFDFIATCYSVALRVIDANCLTHFKQKYICITFKKPILKVINAINIG